MKYTLMMIETEIHKNEQEFILRKSLYFNFSSNYQNLFGTEFTVTYKSFRVYLVSQLKGKISSKLLGLTFFYLNN